jgi:hypothetical protein
VIEGSALAFVVTGLVVGFVSEIEYHIGFDAIDGAPIE